MEPDLLLLALDIKQAINGKAKVKEKKAEDTLKSLKSKVKDDLLGKSPKPSKLPYSISDYSSLRGEAMTGLDVNKILELGLDTEYEEGYMVAIHDFNEKLQSLVPSNVSETIFGIDERDPSDFEKYKFIRKMRVVENPNHIFDLMAKGELSWTELDTLKEFYPSMHQSLVEATVEALSELKGEMDSQLDRDQNRTVSMLLGVTRASPKILEQMKEEKTSESTGDMKAQGTQGTEVQETLKPS